MLYLSKPTPAADVEMSVEAYCAMTLLLLFPSLVCSVQIVIPEVISQEGSAPPHNWTDGGGKESPSTSSTLTFSGSPNTSSSSCGKSHSRSKRVVGGDPVSSSHFPWTVAIFLEGAVYPYCAGVALSGNYILTAAHCMRGKTADMIFIGYGSQYMDYERMDGSEKHVVRVDIIYKHPSFRDIIHGDDIAVLKLRDFLRVSDDIVCPICLPEGIDTNTLVGQDGVVAGWGRISYGGQHSGLLRAVKLPIISHQECCRVFKNVITVREEMFCAGDLLGKKDACQGDSGGALMWMDPDSDRWYVLGIVSFGVKCAEPGYYGTYTKVSSYISWICHVTALCLSVSSE
ncbi:venom protease-like [Ornithodoros turicata]|uniref:venom protease-like n=1 Tax=Ornithodoros turicata TaxID=34597 RepID=UPI0031388DE6